MSAPYCYKYPHPAITTDCVIFGFDGTSLRLLLIERAIDPFKGYWALPGGFVNPDETVEQCALRELREETAMHDVYLEQFKVYSDPGRDPRERVITVAFIALVRPSDHQVKGGDDARTAMWFDADMLPPLAFDHDTIVAEARRRLREILRLRPVAFRLLDELFTVDELRKVYEAVNGTAYDRRNFQRKLMQSGLVSPAEEMHKEIEASTDACCCSMASFDCAEPKRSKGRPGLKFWFNRKKKSDADDDDTDDEASTKDLFSF